MSTPDEIRCPRCTRFIAWEEWWPDTGWTLMFTRRWQHRDGTWVLGSSEKGRHVPSGVVPGASTIQVQQGMRWRVAFPIVARCPNPKCRVRVNIDHRDSGGVVWERLEP